MVYNRLIVISFHDPNYRIILKIRTFLYVILLMRLTVRYIHHHTTHPYRILTVYSSSS